MDWNLTLNGKNVEPFKKPNGQRHFALLYRQWLVPQFKQRNTLRLTTTKLNIIRVEITCQKQQLEHYFGSILCNISPSVRLITRQIGYILQTDE